MSRQPRHILLIEDNADDRAEMRRMLLLGSDHQYRFSEAGMGAEGVKIVLEAQRGSIDCVLLDYAMPDMDAPEVLAALRDGAGMPSCPVVVITGGEAEDGLNLLSAGAQDYVGKRWSSPASLTRAVENAIERFTLLAERDRAESALRTSEERYRALFDSIDAGYTVLEMIFDSSGSAVDARYLQINPAFARQSGFEHAEGQCLRALVPDIEAFWFETYGSVALTGVPVRMERRSEALQRWFDVYAFRLGEPQARQVAVLFTDTTERKRVELELAAAKAEADAASRAKSEFLMSMSHELRSPLSSILGFTQLIESGTPPPTPAQQDSVEQILSAGWYLLGLVNEILDLSAIESGERALSMQAVPLGDVVDDCRAMVVPQAQAAGIELHFACSDQPCATCLDPPCLVQADATRIKQVLLNLLTNAIKYNRSPGHVHVRWATSAGHRVRVSVEDTGPGLSAAQKAQLFQPFNRLGQDAGTAPGTGIGLVISKRLVEMMGGRIGVDSTVGVGSCFWFELESAAAAPVAVRDMPVHTVLCVDDDPVRLRQVEELVARWPEVCLLRARDARDGIEMARSARPDVILMSVHVPDPDGVDTIMLLAKDPATARIPIIPLAVGGLPRELELGLAAGVFGYHAQAVQSELFLHALELTFQPNHADSQRAGAKENT